PVRSAHDAVPGPADPVGAGHQARRAAARGHVRRLARRALAARRPSGAPGLPRDGERHVLPRGEAHLGCAGAGRLPALADALGALAPVLAQLVGRDIAEHACRAADDELPRRDVLRDDGARADEGLLPDLDAGTENRAPAHAGAAADGRAL